jgi:hypothetical protein
MNQILRSGVLLIAACTVPVLCVRGQTVIYSTDFSDAQGWSLTATKPPVVWAADDTPASVLGSPSWRSAPYSLNYNDGVNYNSGMNANQGTATSPVIDLSAVGGSVTLGFWCNWSTEGGPCSFDWRIVQIFGSTTGGGCYTFNECGPPGQWHHHSETISASGTSIQVQFFFDTGDNTQNFYEGWFIDDLEVVTDCLVGVSYCVPKLNSQGCFPTIYTTGTPSMSGTGSAFRIWADDVLNQKVGMLIWGRAPAATPFAGGILCIAPPVTRTAAQNSGGTALPAIDCSGAYVLQFTPAMMSQAGLVQGDDVYSQYWSRDNGFPPPDNVGLTAGVHWSVCP